MSVDRTSMYCVIGAGACGLTAIKNLRQLGIPCQAIEREDNVGGNWYYGRPFSSIYRSTHLISSKQLTEYTDFPMPDEYPAYPSQPQCLEYLRAYARRFDLYPFIEFGRSVEHAEPSGKHWRVRLDGGEERLYRGLIIANGHHWDPQYPNLPGKFDGTVLHSMQYKTPDVLVGKRVLVIGAGNSGCDIAVESAQHAAATFHSSRRGYHFLPKFLFGKPADVAGERLLRWRLPLPIRRLIASLCSRAALGRPQDFGLPAPDHKLFESHPLVNSQMLYFVGHGMITPKPDVKELLPTGARFVDGSEEQLELIVMATGFKISFPFLDNTHIDWKDGRPDLFLNVFHPKLDNLFIVGLIQSDSGLWGLADYQAQLIARYISAEDCHADKAAWFRRLKAEGSGASGGIRYIRTPRHALEIEHFGYRQQMQKLLAQLGKAQV